MVLIRTLFPGRKAPRVVPAGEVYRAEPHGDKRWCQETAVADARFSRQNTVELAGLGRLNSPPGHRPIAVTPQNLSLHVHKLTMFAAQKLEFTNSIVSRLWVHSFDGPTWEFR
jgi:hypothetical protein